LNLCIIIPAYNEEHAIGQCLAEYRQAFPDARIVVIDNNSNDGTADKAKDHLTSPNDLILFEGQQGKGFAVKAGLSRIEADAYLVVDGDATYPADDARRLVGQMLETRADMVVGDRLSEGAYAKQNKRIGHSSGNGLLTYIVSKLAGQSFNDVLSGLRVLSRPFVTALDVRSSGFQLETEMTVIAAYLRAHVVEMPINYRARGVGSYSKLNAMRDGVRILNFAISNWIAFAPMQPFMILAILSGGITAILGLRILSAFFAGDIAAGSTYTTTAAATVAFALVFALSLFFGVALRILGRNDRRREIARFLERKRQWNTRLDEDV